MRFHSSESVNIEMHCHTTHSDGILTPKEILDEAAACGLTHLCITDHDCVSGYGAALSIESGVTVLPAVEISTHFDRRDLHMLGYFLDLTNRRLLEALADMRNMRAKRVFSIIGMMAADGIDISKDDFESRGLTYTRSNVARVLVAKGIHPDFDSAFSEFSSEGDRYYVRKDDISSYEALELILDAGGVPVVAHPAHYNVVDAIVPLADKGLMGIECFHSEQDSKQSEMLRELALRHDLLVTGGSDFHGDALHPSGLGCIQPPIEDKIEFLKLASERGLKVGVEF